MPSYVLIKFAEESDAQEFVRLAEVGEYHIDWPVLRKLDECKVVSHTVDDSVRLELRAFKDEAVEGR